MKNIFIKNCCDGLYNSLDVHFTSACDNKCKHCIDSKFKGLGIIKPDIEAICKTIIDNANKYDDVLFLGGEPCLFLEDLLYCVAQIKNHTKLKVYVTTAVPKVCNDNFLFFERLIKRLDGINLSVQHYDENIADEIRQTKSLFDRQSFYKSLPYKEKIRINLNIVKPFLYKKQDLIDCLLHYDKMNFNEIKLSEIQHGKDYYVSFEKLFNIKLKSPYYSGCQSYIDISEIIPEMKTKLLLKRSCFLCEETLKASCLDAVKVCYKLISPRYNNNYGVVYSNGFLSKGWI